jgi:hypothetical protein
MKIKCLGFLPKISVVSFPARRLNCAEKARMGKDSVARTPQFPLFELGEDQQ